MIGARRIEVGEATLIWLAGHGRKRVSVDQLSKAVNIHGQASCSSGIAAAAWIAGIGLLAMLTVSVEGSSETQDSAPALLKALNAPCELA
jgi:hypothetical protein